MTDELITAAAQALGAPEELVRRSAAARAQAQGVGIEEILSAWAGGQAVAAAPPASGPPPEAPTPVPQPEAATPQPEIAAEPVEEVAVPAEPLPQVAVAVAEEELVEPAPLRARVGLAAGVGAVLGLLLAVVLALGASPLLLDQATVIGEEAPFTAGVLVNLTWFIIVTAIASAAFGALVAIASRTLPGWARPDMVVRGAPGAGWWLGALLGGVVGAIGAAVTGGLLGESLEVGVILPVRETALAVLIGGAALGALVGAAVSALGEPAVMPAAVEEEAREIRHLLVGGIVIPLAGLAAIALLVLPFALLLLQFHGVAPLLAIVAAGGILAFAFLAAYRPGSRISAGEFILAAVGIGIVLLVIALVVLAQQEPGGHEEEVESLLDWLAGST